MIIAADNITSTNPRVAEALRSLHPAPIKEIAKRAEESGAGLIDLNPGPLSERKRDRMAFLVETVREVTDRRVILDSPDPAVIEAGLSSCRDAPIISAVTLEPKKLAAMFSLAAESGADLVALLLDETGFSPPDSDGKMAVAVDIAARADKAGLPPERIIFDPVIPNISWPDAFERLSACSSAIRQMSSGALMGTPCRTMAGISNLLSGFRRAYPRSLERTCLSVMIGAGLSISLMDAFDSDLAEEASQAGKMI